MSVVLVGTDGLFGSKTKTMVARFAVAPSMRRMKGGSGRGPRFEWVDERATRLLLLKQAHLQKDVVAAGDERWEG